MESEQKPEGRNVGLSAGLDDTALKAAAAKLRRLRLTDVGGDKEHPCETVKSALKRGLGGLYDDEAVTYILRHGVRYYLDAARPNADYALTPTMAIVDANLVMDMPKSLVAAGGIDAIVHAIEAYTSVFANEFSDGQALMALGLLRDFLPSSYRNGSSDPVAREKVHNAATIAGIAFANSFLGICHSMAHKIGSAFKIPHGIANGMLIENVILYNLTCLNCGDSKCA